MCIVKWILNLNATKTGRCDNRSCNQKTGAKTYIVVRARRANLRQYLKNETFSTFMFLFELWLKQCPNLPLYLLWWLNMNNANTKLHSLLNWFHTAFCAFALFDCVWHVCVCVNIYSGCQNKCKPSNLRRY